MGNYVFVCILILGFAELIEQSTLRNQKLDAILERIDGKKSESESGSGSEGESDRKSSSNRQNEKGVEEDVLFEEGNQTAVVEHIYLYDGHIKCPLCETVQSSDSSYCWQCQAKFKKESEKEDQ